ncbi:hypothetical protein BDW68DRAFT_182532 [Aspergillus falconensis]
MAMPTSPSSVSTAPQKKKTQAKQPTAPRPSETIRAMCIERDGYCAITKTDEPVEAAHYILRNFCEPEKVEGWKRVVLGPEGTEVLQNMLCLSRDCHGLWGMGQFALQPVEPSEAKTSREGEMILARSQSIRGELPSPRGLLSRPT